MPICKFSSLYQFIPACLPYLAMSLNFDGFVSIMVYQVAFIISLQTLGRGLTTNHIGNKTSVRTGKMKTERLIFCMQFREVFEYYRTCFFICWTPIFADVILERKPTCLTTIHATFYILKHVFINIRKTNFWLHLISL